METVVLVNDQDQEIGSAPKETVHSEKTPLHRGFSVFVFNKNNELLLTQRSARKKTFPGVWTNSVCGHPSPGESYEDAVKRRLFDELGYEGLGIRRAAQYRYRFADSNGIVENEICPVFLAYSNSDPTPNPDEIDGWEWMPWKTFLAEIEKNPDVYSPWSREEAKLITP